MGYVGDKYFCYKFENLGYDFCHQHKYFVTSITETIRSIEVHGLKGQFDKIPGYNSQKNA